MRFADTTGSVTDPSLDLRSLLSDWKRSVSVLQGIEGVRME
jgi:hypothetical protein